MNHNSKLSRRIGPCGCWNKNKYANRNNLVAWYWEQQHKRAGFFLETMQVCLLSWPALLLLFVLCDPIVCDLFVSFAQKILWRYKFSQLKGSSDDGKTRVKLLFQNSESKQIEMKVTEHYLLTLPDSALIHPASQWPLTFPGYSTSHLHRLSVCVDRSWSLPTWRLCSIAYIPSLLPKWPRWTLSSSTIKASPGNTRATAKDPSLFMFMWHPFS